MSPGYANKQGTNERSHLTNRKEIDNIKMDESEIGCWELPQDRGNDRNLVLAMFKLLFLLSYRYTLCFHAVIADEKSI